MKIIFWKNPTSFFGKVICKWSGGNYYHSEILFSDNKVFSASISKFKCLFFDFVYNKNEMDIFDLNLTEDEERVIRNFCIEEEGSWYDIIGIIFSIVLPFQFQNRYWWFCSELCISALQKVNILSGIKAHTKDPKEFYQLLLEARIIIPNKIP